MSSSDSVSQEVTVMLAARPCHLIKAFGIWRIHFQGGLVAYMAGQCYCWQEALISFLVDFYRVVGRLPNMAATG